MYPDYFDTERAAKQLDPPQPNADSVWQDAVIVHEFLFQAYSSGLHKFTPVSEIQQVILKYTGKQVPVDALRILSVLMKLPLKKSSYDRQLIMRVPPLDRFYSTRKLEWEKQQHILERDLASETQEMTNEHNFLYLPWRRAHELKSAAGANGLTEPLPVEGAK